MSNQKKESPIPPSAQLVLDFFENEFADVKFPDVDQRVLQEAAERVFTLAEELQRVEAALQAAREALHEGQEQLLGKCHRALAYARIYAEEDPDLSRRLEAISIPRQGRGKAPAPADAAEARPATRRGRKAAAADPALFAEVPTLAAHANGVGAP